MPFLRPYWSLLSRVWLVEGVPSTAPWTFVVSGLTKLPDGSVLALFRNSVRSQVSSRGARLEYVSVSRNPFWGLGPADPDSIVLDYKEYPCISFRCLGSARVALLFLL